MENGEAAIRRLISGPSWFRDTPHYWAKASLPLAYAVGVLKLFLKVRKSRLLTWLMKLSGWVLKLFR